MNQYKRELVNKLERANKLLKDKDLHLNLVIVGGSAFVLKDLIPRATYDIDSLIRVPAFIADYLWEEIDINSDVLAFETTFGSWQDDVHNFERIEFSNISIKTLSTERLLASRCFSRKKQADLEYIFSTQDINQDNFEQAIEEIYGYTDPTYNNEFYANEELIKSIYKIKGWNYEISNIKNLYKRKA